MASYFDLSKRESQHYSDGWSHLDRWSDLGKAKALPMRQVREPSGIDGGAVYLQRVIVKGNASRKDVAQALRDTMGGTSCRHEYDCCGCASTTVEVLPRRRHSYLVKTTVSFNY